MDLTKEQLEDLVNGLRTVRNKQVEAFDRIGLLEERVQGLLERAKKLEDSAFRMEKNLERMASRKPPGY